VLTGGQRLSANTPVTVTASNIGDLHGNTIPASLETTFDPTSGQVPAIALDWPIGVQSGDITISYLLSDNEGNTLSMAPEYSTDQGQSWQGSSVTGATADIYPADYQGSLIWNSATDLPDQEIDRVWFRITPRDNAASAGQPDSVLIDIDNLAPLWIVAEGSSGHSTLHFWFSEPVTESSATNIANLSLSGGLTAAGIAPYEQWTAEATDAPTNTEEADAVVVGGKLYVVGGWDSGNYRDRLEVYDPVTDGWQSLAPLPAPRGHMVLAELNGKLYALGGDDDSGRTSKLEVYDPSTDTWTAKADAPINPAYWDAQARAIGDSLYINYKDDPGLYIYEPDTDSWVNLSGNLNHWNVATAVIDGKFYVAGGDDDGGNARSELVVFDPQTRSTTQLASAPTAVAGPVGAAIEGKFYLIGGWDNSPSFDIVQIYDPATDTWTTGTAAPVGVSNAFRGGVIGADVYIGRRASGPTGDFLTFDRYSRKAYELTLGGGQTLPPPPNPVTITAANISDWAGNTITADLDTTFVPSAGQPPGIAVYQPAGMRSRDVWIRYIISDAESNPVWLRAEYQLPGETAWRAATVSGDTTEIPAAQYASSLDWASSTDLPDQEIGPVRFRITPRDNETTWGIPDTVLIDVDNRPPVWIAAQGNEDASTLRFHFNEPVNEATATDPGRYALTGLGIASIAPVETWSTEAISVPTFRYNPATVVMDGKLFVIGGDDGAGGDFDGIDVFDPTTDEWSTFTPHPFARSYPAVAVLNGKLYVIGGTDSGGELQSMDIYDPETGSWTTEWAPQFAAWQQSQARAINGRLYIHHYDGVYVYDPPTDTWQNFPSGLAHTTNSAVAVIDDKLYIAGGFNHDAWDYTNSVVMFDPETNSHINLAPMSIPRRTQFGAALDGRMYVVGGDTDSGSPNTLEVYDPATDSWSTMLSAPFNSTHAIGGVLEGDLYFGRIAVGPSGEFLTFDVYSRNLYEMTLDAGQTLPFQQLNLQANTIEDWHSNESGPLSTTFVPENANTDPTITLDGISGEVSGNVDIGYTISDPEGDLVRLIPEFSIDGEATWSRATTGADTVDIAPSGYQGSLTWFSDSDLPVHDLPDVRFRITPSDNPLELGQLDGLSLHVDNNDVPAVMITLSSFSPSDTTWVLDYQLSDTESDTLWLLPAYSEDDGVTWNPASVVGTTVGIAPGAYAGSLAWQVERDLPGAVQEVLFAIEPNDNDVGTSDQTLVRLNALDVPVVNVTGDLSAEQTGDVAIDFQVTDENADPVSLVGEYRDTGGGWNPATVSGDTLLPDPGYYTGTIVWHSMTDMPDVDTQNAELRIIPFETSRQGFAAQVNFHLDNNDAPSATVDAPASLQARDIPISYQLADDEGDLLDLQAFWSSDHGATWQPMTTEAPTTGIDPGSYASQFVWKSFSDLGYARHDSLLVRVVPSDNDPGGEAISGYFRLANYVGDYTGDTAVNFSDFATLVSAWNSQNALHDIGPASGSPPNLSPIGDGAINFEDLAVYLLMWNWSAANPTAASVSGPSTQLAGPSFVKPGAEERAVDRTHPVVLEQPLSDDPWRSDGRVIELVLRVNEISGVTSAGIEFSYDSEKLRFLELRPGSFLGTTAATGPTLIHLKRVDEEEGLITALFGRISPESPAVSGSGELATLRFEKRSPDNSAMELSYDLRDPQAAMLASGTVNSTVVATRIPANFALLQNYPNPFNGTTTIRFQLPTERRVQLYIYNMRGQRVVTVLDQVMSPGYHRVTWNGRNNAGRQVASGIYIYLIQAGNNRQSRKLTIIK
jgi:N-acetylneuraminic acid mutarotase